MEECSCLIKDEQKKLLELPERFEPLFDGTLGNWKNSPVQLKLKEENTKPYHAKPYPTPHSQKQKLKDEVKRLVDYGVLRKINRSEWACPMFTVSKRN